MSRSKGTIKRGSARADIRPAMTLHKRMEDGAVKLASESAGSFYVVTYETRFGEPREIRNLSKPEATARVSALRSRGYATARYRQADLI